MPHSPHEAAYLIHAHVNVHLTSHSIIHGGLAELGIVVILLCSKRHQVLSPDGACI